MKRLTSIAILGAFVALGVTACDSDTGPVPGVESVEVSPSQVTINVGESVQLSAQVSTTGGASSDVNWASSNPSVASVSGDGTVTGASEGTATVTATSVEDGSKQASSVVTVVTPEPAQVSITGYKAVQEDDDDDQPITSPSRLGTECGSACGGDPDYVILQVDTEVDPGAKELQSVELLVGGTVVDSRTITSSSNVAAATALNYTLQVNTLRSFDPEGYVGNVITPTVPNGNHDVAVRATFTDGTTKETSGPTVETENEQRLIWNFLGQPNTVADDDGDRWFGGGPATFSLTIVDFYGLGVSELDIADGSGVWDFGAGAGAAVTLTSEPFQVTLDPADNAGLDAFNDAFLDLTVPDRGAASPAIFTDDGDAWDAVFSSPAIPAEVLGRHPFVGIPPNSMATFTFADGPDAAMDYCGPAAETDDVVVMLADGTLATIVDQFFSAGDFLPDRAAVTDCGAEEFIADMSTAYSDWTIDVTDTGSGDVTSDVGPVSDLGERTNSGYEGELNALVDVLGNAGTITDVGPTDDFGVDRTPMDITGVAPSTAGFILNPDDDNADGEDQDLIFTATDPALADGNPGSGYGVTTVSATHPASGGTATPDVCSGSAGDCSTDRAADGGASGTSEIDSDDLAAVAEGEWDVVATHEDLATLVNTVQTTYNVIIDATDPTTNVTDPPPTSVTTSNNTATFNFAGDAMDNVQLSEVRVEIREELGGGNVAGACDIADPLVSSATDNASQDVFDVTASADDFTVTVTFDNPGGATDQDVCFFIVAEDAALDQNGNPEPNVNNTEFANTLINWNQ